MQGAVFTARVERSSSPADIAQGSPMGGAFESVMTRQLGHGEFCKTMR